ncbi:MAG: response regulator receiver [Bacteroidetes bacterium]|jgi:CheY-like chemotaxis protein|nr:response regulator receiver [Bacteroidota bacterium]
MRKTIKNNKPGFKHQTVMLIDDNELDNFINQKIIEGNHFAERVYVNTGGQSALEFLKNLLVNDDLIDVLFPSVIFIDINMPLMDGFQFIEQFNKLSGSINKEIKLAILTSSINPEDKTKTKDMGTEIAFINKPLTDEALALL